MSVIIQFFNIVLRLFQLVQLAKQQKNSITNPLLLLCLFQLAAQQENQHHESFRIASYSIAIRLVVVLIICLTSDGHDNCQDELVFTHYPSSNSANCCLFCHYFSPCIPLSSRMIVVSFVWPLIDLNNQPDEQ